MEALWGIFQGILLFWFYLIGKGVATLPNPDTEGLWFAYAIMTVLGFLGQCCLTYTMSDGNWETMKKIF